MLYPLIKGHPLLLAATFLFLIFMLFRALLGYPDQKWLFKAGKPFLIFMILGMLFLLTALIFKWGP